MYLLKAVGVLVVLVASVVSTSWAGPPVFGEPAALNSTAPADVGWDISPALATDTNGNWVATWYIANDGDFDVLVARSSDNGATWSPTVALNSNAAVDTEGDSHPDVATDGLGNWVVVWGFYPPWPDDSEIMVARSTDNGASWTAQAYVDPGAPGSDTVDDYYPHVTTDGSGTWLSFWRHGGGEADIYFSRSTDNGATWSVPAPLHGNFLTDTGLDDSPRAAGDGNGNWVVAWYSSDNLGGSIPNSGNIFVSRSADDGVTWSAPTYLNSNAPTDTTYEQDTGVSIATDKLGHWVAAWHSESTLGGTIGSDPDILVARSTDNGATWTAAAPLNTDAAGDTRGDTTASVLTDAKGGWFAIWNANGPPGLMIAQSNDDGATWSAPAPVSASTVDDSGFEFENTAGTDGKGNFVLAWVSDDTLGGTIGTDMDVLVAVGIGCPTTPLSGCREATPDKGVLLVKDNDNDDRDMVAWSWLKGDATTVGDLLDPVSSDPYVMCLYDQRLGSPTLLLSTGLFAGGTCHDKPCWRATASGRNFRDRDRSQEGAMTAVLKSGIQGKAKALFKSKGIGVPTIGLPMVPPVTAQLRNRGLCFSSTYTAPSIKNDATMFKDKSD